MTYGTSVLSLNGVNTTRPPSASISGGLQDLYDGYDYGNPRWHQLAAKAKARNLLDLVANLAPRTALDVGAGDGSVMAALCEQGFRGELSAVEISPRNVEAIKQRGLVQLKAADLFDGYSIPYRDKAFDLVIASHVLEHVEHERLFLSELKRVARYVFIEVPLESTIRLPRDYRQTNTGHINFYSFASLRRLLQTSGLRVLQQRLYDIPLEIVGFRNWPLGLMKFSLRRGAMLVSPTLASKVFTYHCCALCVGDGGASEGTRG